MDMARRGLEPTGQNASNVETPEIAAEHGMAEMSEKFKEMGGKVYIEANARMASPATSG